MLDRGRERRVAAAPDLEQPPLQLLQLGIDRRVEGTLDPARDHARSLGSVYGFFVVVGLGVGVGAGVRPDGDGLPGLPDGVARE